MTRTSDFDLIEALGRARLEARALPAIEEDQRPASEEEGYGLQERLALWLAAQGRGEIAGYKIGATTQSMQDYLGVETPAYGRILSKNIHASGRSLPRDGFFNPGIECEVAFRMAENMPVRAEPWRAEEIGEFVAAVAPAMELVENRYGDFLSAGFPTLVADDFFHKACVIGSFTQDWQDLDLASAAGRILIDGAEAAQGEGSLVMGQPVNALLWLVNKLGTQERALAKDDLVLTGSMTPVIWLESFPSEVRIEIGGLGACEVRIA